MKPNVCAIASIVLVAIALLSAGCTEGGETAGGETVALSDEPLEARPEPGAVVTIPAGEFIMGSDQKPPQGPPLFVPEHKRTLPAYQIDVYEVTNGQFARFQIESDYKMEGDWRRFYTVGLENRPVSNVTWDDAKAYCEWAGGRLPSEAEWEKAARGTDGRPYPWGDDWNSSKTNTNEYGIRNLSEVGSVETDKSPYGVYDTMGNVQEWTSEILKPYRGSPIPRTDAFNGAYVAVRGSSYAMKGGSMFLWTRSGYYPKSQFGLGFRCAQDAPPEPPPAP